MSKPVWRLVNTGSLDGAMNMAVDEAILNAHTERNVPPTIRFYAWNIPTLSIGYFQRVEREVNLHRVREKGVGFVRRATGGRAVLHDQELTYSIVVSEDYPGIPQTVTESYRLFSQGLLEGFRALGLEADLVSLDKESSKEKKGESAACFDSPSWYELVVEGRKVAGSAQTRQRGTILQHGSILLDMDVELLFSLLKFRSERRKQRLKQAFSGKAVAINELTASPVTWEKAVEAFTTGFSKGMDIELQPEPLTPEERAMAVELAATKYGTEEWNMKL
ncbi:MAG: lipoate--protein ligase family protein [Planifilum sp.]